MPALYHTEHTLLELTQALQVHVGEEINGAPTACLNIRFQLSWL